MLQQIDAGFELLCNTLSHARQVQKMAHERDTCAGTNLFIRLRDTE